MDIFNRTNAGQIRTCSIKSDKSPKARCASIDKHASLDDIGLSVGVHEDSLTTETVEGTSLALESVDDVQGGDGLALGVLSVGDGVTDDTLEEGLEDTTGLLVDHFDTR